MPQPSKGNGRYMPGLDGLRALSVLAVIAYHLNLRWASGGLLGVGVFFVLSGYLITDLLSDQWKSSGKMDLKDFWLRRVRRLLPAMHVMLVGVIAWIVWFAPVRLTALWNDVLASVLYVSNWWFIFHHVSYFESFGPPSPLGHLWSLAVEEQFYLIWPLVLAIGYRFIPRKLTGLILVGIVISALAMALLYEPGTDPSRVYYGTDTRAFSLLIGAVLALLWPSRKLSNYASPSTLLSLDLTGGAGLIVIFLMIWQTNPYQVFLYRGGLAVLSLATAAAVAALAHPASRLSRILGWKPLRWLGVRSYGIYLWHYPVIALTNSAIPLEGAGILRAVCQVAASTVIAALSWRFVEEPIRQGAVQRLWRKTHSGGWRLTRNPGSLWTILSCAMLAAFLFYVSTIKLFTTATASAAHDPTKNPISASSFQQEDRINTGVTEPPNDLTETRELGIYSPDPSALSSEAEPSAAADQWRGVTAIGDSVIVDADPYLQELLPGIVVDGKIGRQMSEAQAVIDQLKQDGKLGSRILIELGTNGPFTKKQLESLLGSLGDMQQIFLVNTRVPRPWEDTVNTMLADAAKSFTHTTLIDWYEASNDKSSYFYADGVHLKPDGARFYTSLLAKAIHPAD